MLEFSRGFIANFIDRPGEDALTVGVDCHISHD
jgi:hypothetical protein